MLQELKQHTPWEGKFGGLLGDQNYSCILGIGMPLNSLTVDHLTLKQSIKQFCYQDDRPVIGYLSYEYGYVLKLGKFFKNHDMPLGCFKKYSVYLIYKNGVLSIYTQNVNQDIPWISLLSKDYTSHLKALILSVGAIKASMGKYEFEDIIHKAKLYIKNGYTFQLNISICFELKIEIEDIQNLFLYIMQMYPASQYAFIRINEFAVVSASPEKFLEVAAGKIQATPIKGTYQMPPDKHDFEAGKMLLLQSQKESQELSMIVDLIRNDLSLNSEIGSVKVLKHKLIFQVGDLLHMHSIIISQLHKDKDVIDLLLDAFPGGSVTGFPKKKTIEIINELEPHTREIYCGSIFVIEGHKDLKASIAIRSGYLNAKNNVFKFYAGSGITGDSDPNAEYDEILAKASNFFRIFNRFVV